MVLIKEIGYLIKKEILLEWRQKYALGGILLYVLSTNFIIYLAFREISPPAWNALFWIITLFIAVNAVLKSFSQENNQRQLYYYTLAHPTAIILSKIIYNTGLLLLMCILSYLTLSFIVGSPVKDNFQFWTALILGSFGLSISLTFISAIAAKSNNSATLMAILSFPVVIPILLMLIKISAYSIRLLQSASIWKEINTLIAIDLILLAMAFILFPFLWRD